MANDDGKGFDLLLASPALLLSGGKREVTARFILDPDNLAYLRATLDEMPAAAPNQSRDQALREGCRVALSGAAGWVPVPGFSFGLAEADEPMLVLDFSLSAEHPACVPNPSLFNDDPDAPPLLKLELDPGAILYSLLTRLQRARVELEVRVTGLSGLEVQGARGPVPAGEPFAPFGPVPQCGVGITVSHSELAAKRIDHVELHLEWDDFLRGASSLQAYYHGYGKLQFDDAQFQVRMEAGSGARWQPVGGNGTLPLFANGNYTVSSFAADLPEDGPSAALRLTLAGPPHAFGHREYPAIFADQASVNAGAIVHQKTGATVTLQPVVAAPLTPLVTAVTLDYAAHDSVTVVCTPDRSGASLPEDIAHGVGNAGVVLLWPFLAGYFGALGMLDGGAFRSEQDRARAPWLLQLLASGEMAAPQEGMLLNKILCGIDGDAALPFPAPVTEAEATLAGQLLRSVTQHWSQLANTTVPVLRETFLMREGRLVQREANWALSVTPGPFDMLPQSLPWGLSMVRLPWMQGLLTVEWKR